MIESEIQNQIRVELSREGAVAFRNNTGQAWTGIPTRLGDGSVLLKCARPIRFGLHVGSSDLIGYHSITVTPEMVGTRIAVFLAVECKAAKGRTSKEQDNFIQRVQDAGGIAFVARSAADVVRGLKSWINRMSLSNSEKR